MKLSFSNKWEDAYAQNKHYSLWPWSNLISIFYRVYNRNGSNDILELGCGAGANIPFFKTLSNVNFYGNDGSSTAIDFLKNKFPELKNNLQIVDFSKSMGFEKKFDMIFDRGAMSCNTLSGIKACLTKVDEQLKVNGYFLGIDWYSTNSSFRKLGKAIGDDDNTRGEYEFGPFKDVEPAHFFSRKEILELFPNYQMTFLQHTDTETYDNNLEQSYHHTAWNFIMQKKK